jgi:N-acetylglucosaminyldiphosphoundecaprenol N-acetyl-beta-D-mannosaminyltransferase
MTETRLLGVRITAQTYEHAIAELLRAAREHRRVRAYFSTVHSLVEATSNAELRKAFESADVVCMDGMPLVWASRLRGVKGAERVCGPDVLLSLADLGRGDGLRHYFLGGAPGVADRVAQNLSDRFPGLVVAGTQSPPFRPLNDAEQRDLVETVNAADAHVLWIGLGAPKQEVWAAAHEGALVAPLLLPVGAAFDFYGGRLRRAPRWMRRIGMEWLFRVAMEPRRLFRRYLWTNTRFVFLLARETVGRWLGRAA